MTRPAALQAERKRFLFSSLLLLLSACPLALFAQQDPAQHVGVPLDWSTRHILFTNQSTTQDRIAAMRDPRFYINWLQRSSYLMPREPIERPFPLPKKHKHIGVDWAMPLGGTGGMPVGESPAKYSFSESGYNCATDFAVYTIGATPSSTQANIVAFNNLYTGTSSSSCPFGPQTPPTTDFTQPTFMWSYAAGSGPSYMSPTLSLD